MIYRSGAGEKHPTLATGDTDSTAPGRGNLPEVAR